MSLQLDTTSLGTPSDIKEFVDRLVKKGLVIRPGPLAAPSQASCLHDWLEDRPHLCRFCGKTRKLNCQGKFAIHLYNHLDLCRRCGRKRPTQAERHSECRAKNRPKGKPNCRKLRLEHEWGPFGRCKNCGRKKRSDQPGASARPRP